MCLRVTCFNRKRSLTAHLNAFTYWFMSLNKTPNIDVLSTGEHELIIVEMFRANAAKKLDNIKKLYRFTFTTCSSRSDIQMEHAKQEDESVIIIRRSLEFAICANEKSTGVKELVRYLIISKTKRTKVVRSSDSCFTSAYFCQVIPKDWTDKIIRAQMSLPLGF